MFLAAKCLFKHQNFPRSRLWCSWGLLMRLFDGVRVRNSTLSRANLSVFCIRFSNVPRARPAPTAHLYRQPSAFGPMAGGGKSKFLLVFDALSAFYAPIVLEKAANYSLTFECIEFESTAHLSCRALLKIAGFLSCGTYQLRPFTHNSLHHKAFCHLC